MTVRHDFSNRSVLVIGGTSGIGRATALAFARAGANVAIAARHRPTSELFYVETDVRDEASVANAIATTVARFGRLDFAVNSHGVGGDMAPLETASQAIWDDVMAVNARGTWLAMRSEIAAMSKHGSGVIVNMSSIYGVAGKAAHHAYVASKHAVLGMTRSVALEVATRGIRVNAICAGVTRTEGMIAAERAVPDLVRGLVAEHPIARMATEDEIAGTVLWLCSPDAGFVTGAPIYVDGGFLAA